MQGQKALCHTTLDGIYWQMLKILVRDMAIFVLGYMIGHEQTSVRLYILGDSQEMIKFEVKN